MFTEFTLKSVVVVIVTVTVLLPSNGQSQVPPPYIPLLGTRNSAGNVKVTIGNNLKWCGDSSAPIGMASLTSVSGAVKKWSRLALSYRVRDYSSRLTEHQVNAAVATAFKFWSEVTQLIFTRVSGHADIVIRFAKRNHGDSRPFDGPDGALAHSSPPEIGHAHFDDDEAWTVASPVDEYSVSLVQVMTHQIGHVLGLHHSTDANSVMYPFYVYRKHFRLTSADVKDVQNLYGINTGTTVYNDKTTKTVETSTQIPTTVEKNTTPPPTTTITTTASTTTAPTTTAPTTTTTASATTASTTTAYTTTASITTAPTTTPAPTTTITTSKQTTTYFPTTPVATTPATTTAATTLATTTATNEPQPGDICKDPTFDAITIDSRGYIFAFKGSHYYALNSGRSRVAHPISSKFPGLPSHVDSSVSLRGLIYFFKDDQVYVYSEQGRLQENYPRPINQILPSVNTPITAAFHIGRYAYFINGFRYFRVGVTATGFSARIRQVRNPYSNAPPTPLDAVFNWSLYSVYSFSGPYYYQVRAGRVAYMQKKLISKKWLHCDD